MVEDHVHGDDGTVIAPAVEAEAAVIEAPATGENDVRIAEIEAERDITLAQIQTATPDPEVLETEIAIAEAESTAEFDAAAEIAALREEIAALREGPAVTAEPVVIGQDEPVADEAAPEPHAPHDPPKGKSKKNPWWN